jgi:hypothetical protein
MTVLLSTSALAILALLVILPTGMLRHHSASIYGTGGVDSVACSIWAWAEGTWQLMERCGQAGCDCAPPLDRPGRYEGEVVRHECPALVEVVVAGGLVEEAAR